MHVILISNLAIMQVVPAENKDCLSYTINAMAAYDMMAQGARASALTWLL